MGSGVPLDFLACVTTFCLTSPRVTFHFSLLSGTGSLAGIPAQKIWKLSGNVGGFPEGAMGMGLNRASLAFGSLTRECN